MALDLTALEERPTLPASGELGKPMEIPLSDIEEDPNQPRTEFTKEAMAEITASIKARGVKQPVSVRSHPTEAGKWILNFGARRFRASKAAGKDTIPAFIDEAANDFDQVIENEHRDNLKPMELALFIQRKIDEGMKKAEIARHLGRDGSAITHHLALISAPDCVEDAYRTGKCTSAKTLYELRALFEKYGEPVAKWCLSVDEITRKGVSDLSKTLSGEGAETPKVGPSTSKSLGHDQEPTEPGEGSAGGNTAPSETTPKPLEFQAGEGGGTEPEDGKGEGNDNGELTSWPKGKAISDPDLMKKPLLIVEYEGRAAAVLLNRKPSTPGLIRIRYEDGGGDDEVDAGKLKINQLTEGTV